MLQKMKGLAIFGRRWLIKNPMGFLFMLLFFQTSSCTPIEVTEKIVELPKHVWAKNHQAMVEIDSPDSAAYQLYLLLRHTQQYPYNNILLHITVQDTTQRTLSSFTVNAPLTTLSGKWAGGQIDDLVDHRIRLATHIALNKNRYRFTITQLMKEDPLPYILNTGIAIEKINDVKHE